MTKTAAVPEPVQKPPKVLPPGPYINGIPLRDYMAAAALTGLLGGKNCPDPFTYGKKLAALAYELADFMTQERLKEG